MTFTGPICCVTVARWLSPGGERTSPCASAGPAAARTNSARAGTKPGRRPHRATSDRPEGLPLRVRGVAGGDSEPDARGTRRGRRVSAGDQAASRRGGSRPREAGRRRVPVRVRGAVPDEPVPEQLPVGVRPDPFLLEEGGQGARSAPAAGRTARPGSSGARGGSSTRGRRPPRSASGPSGWTTWPALPGRCRSAGPAGSA